jgi:hypothetical protein
MEVSIDWLYTSYSGGLLRTRQSNLGVHKMCRTSIAKLLTAFHEFCSVNALLIREPQGVSA